MQGVGFGVWGLGFGVYDFLVWGWVTGFILLPGLVHDSLRGRILIGRG